MKANITGVGGYATKNNIKCTDGRTIRKDAFKDCDGLVVPFVWMHIHDDPDMVLGHAALENRDDGVYARCEFNETAKAETAKNLIAHGDVMALSIYANQLVQRGGDVIHGMIRDVSLVLAGANPGARIDDVSFAHSADEDYDDGEAVVCFNGGLELLHADSEKEDEAESKDEKKEDKKMAEKTVKDVFDSMTEEQKNVVYYMIGQALEQKGAGNDEGDEKMKHNVFDNDTHQNTLSHDDMKAFIESAKRLGSMKKAFEENVAEGGALAHAVYDDNGNAVTYGIANMDYLFPDYRNVGGNEPDFIRRNDEWVNVVMNGVHRTPFARVKSVHANITMDEARARGYTKGNRKVEEVFSLLKRTTDPQTIYKKQKIDRDDVIDITTMDVIAYMKGEMRLMLNEEAARAILVGDGRLSTDDDKIFPNHIRPVWGDDELYTIQVHVTAGANDAATAKAMIRNFIKARKNYKGSGNLVFFTTEDWLSEMLLLEDGMGHELYADEAALAKKLRVRRIVTSPVLENQTSGGETLAALALDLSDYNVGADKGGEVNMFDDFDIDFNQMKYLIESRFSGALVRPFSALAVIIGGTATTYTAATPVGTENPMEEGWYEKQGELYLPTHDATVKQGKTYYEKG